MNVAYAPIAQTILVDKRHEQGFAAKVSTIDPRTMPRRTWQFVDTARHYDDTGAHANILTGEQDGDWLSGKLRYRDDSPFADWLRSQTQDERFDALCVTAIDDTDRTNRQVQADGQIKSGARGQHGTKDRAQVIGFVNETYLNALAAQVDAARNALSQADTDYTAAKTQSDNLHRELELANQLAYTSWERIDIAGAQRTITDTQDAIASIKNDPKLAELAKQRDELNAELDRVERQRIESDQAAARAAAPSKRRSSGCATMPTPARRTPPVPPPTMTMTPLPARCRTKSRRRSPNPTTTDSPDWRTPPCART